MDKVILLSGGIDSAAAAILTKPTRALFVDYGQHAAKRELAAARVVAKQLDIRLYSHKTLHSEPDHRGIYQARNMMLISLAAVTNPDEIVIGCALGDHEVFHDCRPDYLWTVQTLLQPFQTLLTTPVMRMSRKEICEIAKDITGTWSCYSAGPVPCGECLSCTQ